MLAGDGAAARLLDYAAVLAVHTRLRRGPGVTGIAAAACAVFGCFNDSGPGELTPTTIAAESSTSGVPTGSGVSTSEGSTTAAEPPGIAFRLSELNIIDPHFFLTNQDDPSMCIIDATMAINDAVNKDIGEGGFNLVIYFEELVPGAEMRLFQGECTDPMDGSPWTCIKAEGVQQTVFDTMQLLEGQCRELDPAVLQPVNAPTVNDPPPPCVRTSPQDFSVAVSNSAGPLFLRNAQIVASPDSLDAPQTIPNGLLYGFLPMAAAQNIMVEVPLTGTVSVWSVIDVMCTGQFPDQLPSIDVLADEMLTGAWIAINFKAERVFYTP